MHCARLGFQCVELLTTRHLALPIQGEPADWQRAVRRGQVTFEDWWDRSLRLDTQLQALADDDTIPPDKAPAAAAQLPTRLLLVYCLSTGRPGRFTFRGRR